MTLLQGCVDPRWYDAFWDRVLQMAVPFGLPGRCPVRGKSVEERKVHRDPRGGLPPGDPGGP
jgi:hypothetical protein